MNHENTEGAIRISADIHPSTVNAITTNPITDAQRAFVLNLQSQYRGFVRARIKRVLDQCGDLGLGYDPVLGTYTDPLAVKAVIDEIEGTVWFKVLENLDRWMRPGYSNTEGRPPAKLSTRLSDAAMWQAMGWRKSQLRDRPKFVGFDDGVRIEAALFDRAHGYGRYYPEGLKPRPFDETPKVTTPIPFDHSARFFCVQCRALQLLAAGYVVEEVADPSFTLRCGHSRRLSGSVQDDCRARAAA